MDQSVVEVKNPKVEIPTVITIGSQAYEVAFLSEICNNLCSGCSVTKAIKEAQEKFAVPHEQLNINNMRALLRNKFRCDISKFSTLSKQKIADALLALQRIELVRQLRRDKWREGAIVESMNNLFPGLKPLTSKDLVKIREYHEKRSAQSLKKRAVRDTAQRVRTWNQNAEYVITITGPSLQYKDNVSKTKAKEILRALILED